MRLDRIDEGMGIYQYEDGFCYGTDAVLLSAFTDLHDGQIGAELGTGCGIIPILLCRHRLPGHIYAFEIQQDYADLAQKNVDMCGFGDKISVMCGDFKNCADYGIEGLDFVFSNPPYMKTTSGRLNQNARQLISRHEIHCDINDVCASAARLLKNGGYFYAVYRPDRLADMIYALKLNGLIPKKLLPVQSHAGKSPNLFLVKARKSGSDGGLKLCAPLILYTQGANMTPELEYIYRFGRMRG